MMSPSSYYFLFKPVVPIRFVFIRISRRACSNIFFKTGRISCSSSERALRRFAPIAAAVQTGKQPKVIPLFCGDRLMQ